MLACRKCGNTTEFVQIAFDQINKPMERNIHMILRARGQIAVNKTSWTSSDQRSAGIFCTMCRKRISLEDKLLEDLDLSDVPLSALPPEEFEAEKIVSKIKKVIRKTEIFEYTLPPKPSSFSTLSKPLEKSILNALEKQGIDISKLYTHQARAIENILDSRNVVISTATASGKTLCFNVPVINTLVKDENARALYIYPTKALAQDQIMKLLMFADNSEELSKQHGSFFKFKVGGNYITLGKYDGSTSEYEKTYMRRTQNPNILMTNPDMLHFGILRHNRSWKDLISNLRFVVLDDIHVYKGIFGSNVALVIRRLRKLCSAMKADPVFILCSATIGNPTELAKLLTGCKDFVLINDDGSPRKKRKILLLNPPTIEGSMERLEPTTVAVDLLTKVMFKEKRPIKNIVFGRSRLSVKNMYRFTSARLKKQNDTKGFVPLLREYTATLKPEKREEIGKELSNGRIASIVATNALELGIDIGDISSAICVGYPGSIASIYQQMGRAGRKGEGLGIIILQSNPLEQYFMRNAEEFLNKEPEEVRINPMNEFLLQAHLACCAYECEDYGGLFDTDFESFFGLDAKTGNEYLSKSKDIYKRIRNKETCWLWKRGEPEYKSIRNPISKYKFSIVCDGREVGVMDSGTVLRDLHPGAVWSDQDETYVVQSLDFKEYVAKVVKKEVNYYTMAISIDSIRVKSTNQRREINEADLAFGNIDLERAVFMYRKIKYSKKKNEKDEIRKVEQHLPKISFRTQSAWLVFDREHLSSIVGDSRLEGGIHAIEHAFVSILPRFVECDPNDIDGFSDIRCPATGYKPTIFIFDNFSGGIGLSEAFYKNFKHIVKQCIQLIKTCKCKNTNGCPACIQIPRCSKRNEPLDKDAAIAILKSLI